MARSKSTGNDAADALEKDAAIDGALWWRGHAGQTGGRVVVAQRLKNGGHDGGEKAGEDGGVK